MTFRSLALLVLTSSCARALAPPPSETASPEVASSAIALALADAGGPPMGSVRLSGSAATPEPPPTSPAASAAPSAVSPALPLDGKDFVAQVRTLFRVAACGPSGEVPSRFDAATVTRHCDELARAYADYRKTWVDVAKPFIASLRPKDLPRVVVYPFGGGDLTSALVTFPDASEITTISLEPGGDVRPIDTLPTDRVAGELWGHRTRLERLFEKAHSRTDNLEKESKTELPGEIVFALAALAVHGDEPVGLRYFRLRRDGSLAYVTQADIDAVKTAGDRRALFANAELIFRRAGAVGELNTPAQVLRHISYNLDDAHLAADPSLFAHLAAKGKVATMTKAASHLLWSDRFALLRSWLLEHTDWMISDSTGIPPRFASHEGFVQDAYGVFDGPAAFGSVDIRDSADFKALFASQPARALPFRYGYPDKNGHAHLIVTRRTGVF
jgi:hypothetical protein